MILSSIRIATTDTPSLGNACQGTLDKMSEWTHGTVFGVRARLTVGRTGGRGVSLHPTVHLAVIVITLVSIAI